MWLFKICISTGRRAVFTTLTIFLLLAIISLSYLNFFTKFTFLQDFYGNIISELIGIFLTVAVVDHIFALERKKEAEKFKFIAYKKLKFPLQKIFQLFSDSIKASLNPNKDYDSLPDNFVDLFNSDLVDEMQYLDFSQAAPVYGKSDWVTHMSHEIPYHLDEISNIIDKYMPFLDATLVEKLENLEEDVLLQFCRKFKVVLSDLKKGMEKPEILKLFAPNRGTKKCKWIKDSLSKYSEIINFIESDSNMKFLTLDKTYWKGKSVPKIGENRIEGDAVFIVDESERINLPLKPNSLVFDSTILSLNL